MSNNFSVTLKNFTLMEDADPKNFEVYLLILKSGRMSAACWDVGAKYPNGIFRQSRGGIIEAEDVYAYLPIEEVSVDLS